MELLTVTMFPFLCLPAQSGFPSDRLSSLDLRAVVIVVSKCALSVLGT